jgi:hypothetical protein
VNKVGVQEAMIKELWDTVAPHPTKFTILGGDLNFVEHEKDTTSEFRIETRPDWDIFKKKLDIFECVSDLHTLFRKPSPAW